MEKLQNDITKGARKKTKRIDKNKKRRVFLISALIFLFVTLSAIGAIGVNEWLEYRRFVAYMRQVVEVDTIYHGISVDGVALGGMTYDEANNALLGITTQKLEALRFELKFDENTWLIDHEDINARFDYEENLLNAFSQAREGQLRQRYDQIKAIEDNGLMFATELEYDADLLSKQIDDIAEQINLLPQDAQLEFLPDEEEKFIITSEKHGLQLNRQQVVEDILHRLKESQFGVVELQPEILEPTVFSSDLEKITHRIAQFYTGFGTSSQNRIHNVKFALSKVNGYRLNPGEIFSFNEVVGRRVVERGFRPAPIIMPDRSLQDSPGGGVCQASTMMYNAALRADLEIVERRHHSFPVFYVPPGLDAAVVYGAVDVKFRNNRETPVFFRTFYENGKIYVEVYGESFPDKGEIRVVSRITETIDAPVPKRVLDIDKEHVTNPGEEKIHVENRQGLRVTSVMYYYENGEQIWSRVITNDFYRPIQGIIYYLPPLPEPVEPEQPALPSPTPPNEGTEDNRSSG